MTLPTDFKILVFEREHRGHRFSAVRVLIEALLVLQNATERKLVIVLATTAAACESEEFAEQLAHLADRFETRLIGDDRLTGSGLQGAKQKLDNLLKLVRTEHFDHLYLPYGDGLLQLLALRLLVPGARWPRHLVTEAIVMRSNFGYPDVSLKSRIASVVAMWCPRIDRLHLIDPIPYESIANRWPSLMQRINLMPIPIAPGVPIAQAEARKSLGLPLDAKLVVCVGVIDERKGVDALINAFLALPANEERRLVLAGRHSPKVLAILNQTPGAPIISINRYLSDDELNCYVNAADIIAAPYPNFVGSASIVIRACAAGRVCLASDSPWMQRVVEQFDLGLTINPRNQTAMTAGLTQCLSLSDHFALSQQAEALLAFSNMNNIATHLTSLLYDRLAIRRARDVLLWPGLRSSQGNNKPASLM